MKNKYSMEDQTISVKCIKKEEGFSSIWIINGKETKESFIRWDIFKDQSIKDATEKSLSMADTWAARMILSDLIEELNRKGDKAFDDSWTETIAALKPKEGGV